MKKDYLAIGIVVIVGVFLYSYWENKPTEVTDTDPAPVLVVDDKSIKEDDPQSILKVTEAPKTNLPAPEPKTENPVLAENFRNNLNKVAECIDADKSNALLAGVNPTFDSLIQIFNNRYGEYVVSLEDWVQSDVKMADGTLRRIRVDTTYIDQSSPERRITVFGIDRQGSPEVVALDPEKSFNPDEAYISSFTTGSTPMLIEKSQRVYFQNGEELILVERNGIIESMSFSGNGKTATCSALDRETPTECQCF